MTKLVTSLIAIFLIGFVSFAVFVGGQIAERRDIREQEYADLRSRTNYLVWPKEAISVALHADKVEKGDKFVVFTNLRTGNLVEMPLCSIRSIEKVSSTIRSF